MCIIYGLGDLSLLNNETTRKSTSWPGSWESSGSLLELSIAAGPLLLLVLGPLLLDYNMLLLGPAVNDSIWRALHMHYSRKTAQLFYALCFCRLIIPEIMPAFLDSSLIVYIWECTQEEWVHLEAVEMCPRWKVGGYQRSGFNAVLTGRISTAEWRHPKWEPVAIEGKKALHNSQMCGW